MQCGECGFRTVDCPTEAEALAAWNARPLQAELVGIAGRLLASLYPDALDPEQFNAWCDLQAAITRATGAAS